MLQRRKKYRNKTIMGYKRLASAFINLSQVSDQKPFSGDVPLYPVVGWSKVTPTKKDVNNFLGDDRQTPLAIIGVQRVSSENLLYSISQDVIANDNYANGVDEELFLGVEIIEEKSDLSGLEYSTTDQGGSELEDENINYENSAPSKNHLKNMNVNDIFRKHQQIPRNIKKKLVWLLKKLKVSEDELKVLDPSLIVDDPSGSSTYNNVLTNNIREGRKEFDIKDLEKRLMNMILRKGVHHNRRGSSRLIEMDQRIITRKNGELFSNGGESKKKELMAEDIDEFDDYYNEYQLEADDFNVDDLLLTSSGSSDSSFTSASGSSGASARRFSSSACYSDFRRMDNFSIHSLPPQRPLLLPFFSSPSNTNNISTTKTLLNNGSSSNTVTKIKSRFNGHDNLDTNHNHHNNDDTNNYDRVPLNDNYGHSHTDPNLINGNHKYKDKEMLNDNDKHHRRSNIVNVNSKNNLKFLLAALQIAKTRDLDVDRLKNQHNKMTNNDSPQDVRLDIIKKTLTDKSIKLKSENQSNPPLFETVKGASNFKTNIINDINADAGMTDSKTAGTMTLNDKIKLAAKVAKKKTEFKSRGKGTSTQISEACDSMLKVVFNDHRVRGAKDSSGITDHIDEIPLDTKDVGIKGRKLSIKRRKDKFLNLSKGSAALAQSFSCPFNKDSYSDDNKEDIDDSNRSANKRATYKFLDRNKSLTGKSKKEQENENPSFLTPESDVSQKETVTDTDISDYRRLNNYNNINKKISDRCKKILSDPEREASKDKTTHEQTKTDKKTNRFAIKKYSSAPPKKSLINTSSSKRLTPISASHHLNHLVAGMSRCSTNASFNENTLTKSTLTVEMFEEQLLGRNKDLISDHSKVWIVLDKDIACSKLLHEKYLLNNMCSFQLSFPCDIKPFFNFLISKVYDNMHSCRTQVPKIAVSALNPAAVHHHNNNYNEEYKNMPTYTVVCLGNDRTFHSFIRYFTECFRGKDGEIQNKLAFALVPLYPPDTSFENYCSFSSICDMMCRLDGKYSEYFGDDKWHTFFRSEINIESSEKTQEKSDDNNFEMEIVFNRIFDYLNDLSRRIYVPLGEIMLNFNQNHFHELAESTQIFVPFLNDVKMVFNDRINASVVKSLISKSKKCSQKDPTQSFNIDNNPIMSLSMDDEMSFNNYSSSTGSYLEDHPKKNTQFSPPTNRNNNKPKLTCVNIQPLELTFHQPNYIHMDYWYYSHENPSSSNTNFDANQNPKTKPKLNNSCNNPESNFNKKFERQFDKLEERLDNVIHHKTNIRNKDLNSKIPKNPEIIHDKACPDSLENINMGMMERKERLHKRSIKAGSRFQYMRVSRESAPTSNNLLTLRCGIKEKKQTFKNLGKKSKINENSDILSQNNVQRLVVCSTKSLTHPLKVIVDGVEWNGVKFFQVSSQWQTHIKYFPLLLSPAQPIPSNT
ncbi:uncharacterized protein LOC135929975 isoform X2 [Gordionus sp. m RMFG-2023]